MAKEEWTHVRIRKSTKLRLEVFAYSLLKAHDQNKLKLPSVADRLPTMDDCIGVLLTRDTNKRRRVKEAKQRRAKARREDTTSGSNG